MVEELEQLASSEKVKLLVMNVSREAVEFYRKCGFLEVGGAVSFGRIPHRQMIKSLSPLQTIHLKANLAAEFLGHYVVQSVKRPGH